MANNKPINITINNTVLLTSTDGVDVNKILDRVYTPIRHLVNDTRCSSTNILNSSNNYENNLKKFHRANSF